MIAINPIAPTPTALQAEMHAVELNAFVNPLTTLQEMINKSIANLTLLSTGLTTAAPALLQSLGNPAIYTEFAELITANATNPLPLLEVLQGLPGTYGDQVTTALQSASQILQTKAESSPTRRMSSSHRHRHRHRHQRPLRWSLPSRLSSPPARPVEPQAAPPAAVRARAPAAITSSPRKRHLRSGPLGTEGLLVIR